MATITFRTDAEVDVALARLVSDGRDRSAAIRQAILTAARFAENTRLRAEAEALAADDADVAEAREVLSELEALRAW